MTFRKVTVACSILMLGVAVMGCGSNQVKDDNGMNAQGNGHKGENLSSPNSYQPAQTGPVSGK